MVSIDYTLRDDTGQVLDQSGEQPLAYLHGHQNIIPGLERALEGLEPGADARAQIQPNDGYGTRSDDKVIQVSRAELPNEIDPEVGMILSGQTPDGQSVPLIVTGVNDSAITLDGNHPLAGKNLDFEVKIREVREATNEELAHGHVHGPGGHSH